MFSLLHSEAKLVWVVNSRNGPLQGEAHNLFITQGMWCLGACFSLMVYSLPFSEIE